MKPCCVFVKEIFFLVLCYVSSEYYPSVHLYLYSELYTAHTTIGCPAGFYNQFLCSSRSHWQPELIVIFQIVVTLAARHGHHPIDADHQGGHGVPQRCFRPV